MSMAYCTEGRLADLAVLRTDYNTNLRLVLLKNPTAVYDATYVYAAGDIATFGGYAPITPVWPAVGNDGFGNGVTNSPMYTFAASGVAPANTIYAWGLWHAGDLKFRQVKALAAPKTMAASGDLISITPTLFMEQGA